jgi:hypothetical protein
MFVAYVSDAKTVPARFRTPSLQWNILKIEGVLCAGVTQASCGWFGQRGGKQLRLETQIGPLSPSVARVGIFYGFEV